MFFLLPRLFDFVALSTNVALIFVAPPKNRMHGREIATMLTEQDWIGIVPEGVFPRYCDSYFPDEGKMLQFMNLPEEEADAVIDAAIWYPLDEVRLASQ